MYQLIKKEILTQRKLAYVQPLFLLVWLLNTGSGSTFNVTNNSFLPVVNGFIAAYFAYLMVVFSNFGTKESDKRQNRLVLSLPVRRRSVIDVKYAMISCWWLFTYFFCVIFTLLLKVIFQATAIQISFRSLIFSLCITYLLSSITYPVYYKFGYKITQFIAMLFLFLFFFFIEKISHNGIYHEAFSEVTGYPMIAIIIVTVIMVFASYFLSIHFYQKEEF